VNANFFNEQNIEHLKLLKTKGALHANINDHTDCFSPVFDRCFAHLAA
jgi:hypothetical protein